MGNRRKEDKIAAIKEKTKSIKAAVLKNIHENLNDQVSEDSFYRAWSALDLSDKNSSVEERIERIQPLMEAFAEDRSHQVQKYTDAKETKLGPRIWKGHSVYLHYPAILSCSAEELADEMSRAWPTIARFYQKAHQETNGKPVQRNIWKKFLDSPDSGIMYPNMCDFVMIMLSTPANTSPLERSYTFLEMICAPLRNHVSPGHLELLYLLKSLNIPVKSSAGYADAVKLLPEM